MIKLLLIAGIIFCFVKVHENQKEFNSRKMILWIIGAVVLVVLLF